MSDQVSQPDQFNEQAKAVFAEWMSCEAGGSVMIIDLFAAALSYQERADELAALRAELENQNRFLGLVIAERDQLQQRLDAAERELEHVKTVEFPKKAEAVAKANRLAALREVKADVDRRLSCLVDFGGQSVRLIESELKSVADVIAARIEKAKP